MFTKKDQNPPKQADKAGSHSSELAICTECGVRHELELKELDHVAGGTTFRVNAQTDKSTIVRR